jgi:hypothetical protein
MKLSTWMAKQPRGRVRQLAAEYGIRLATFYDAAEHGLVRVDVARRLSEATGGKVSAAELLGLKGAA